MKKTLIALFLVMAATLSSVQAGSVDFYTALSSNDGTFGGILIPLGVDQYKLATNFGYTFGDDLSTAKNNTFIGLAGIPVPILDEVQVNVNFSEQKDTVADTDTELGFAGVNIERHFVYEIVKNVEIGINVDLIRFTSEDNNLTNKGISESSFTILGSATPMIQVKLFEL